MARVNKLSFEDNTKTFLFWQKGPLKSVKTLLPGINILRKTPKLCAWMNYHGIVNQEAYNNKR